MDAKNYLKQIRILAVKERILEQEIAGIRAEMESVDVSVRSTWPDGQPHGTGITDPVGEKAAADVDAQIQERRRELMGLLRDVELKLLRTQTDLYTKRVEIIEQIGQVQDAQCCELLNLRYVRCETWEQIAVTMGKTYQWVAGPLHGKSLQLMEEILKKSKK